VDNIGVTRSTPVKNLAPAFAAFYGIVFFNEYVITQPRELSMTLGGVALMVLAAYFIGRAGAQEHERARAFDVSADANQRKQSFKLGILCSLSAAFFYGAYSVPLKWLFKHDVSPYTACAWLGIGVVASALAVRAVDQPLSRLVGAADRFGGGDLRPIDVGRMPAELEQLAEAMNNMGERLRAVVGAITRESIVISGSASDFSARSEELAAASGEISTGCPVTNVGRTRSASHTASNSDSMIRPAPHDRS
jgi:methyl-accepting chemotaxis protein